MSAQTSKIGFLQDVQHGLPCFNYTGILPAIAKMPNGQIAKLPEDPWFLLGNYRLTLFAHVSGQYELICGERDWGRLNQGNDANTGLNSASLKISTQNKIENYQLTGMKSVAADSTKCKRAFGVGFASYVYSLDNVSCSRILSVKPSSNPYNGISAFLLQVKLKNKSSETLRIAYNESITANYESILQQHQDEDTKRVKYQNLPSFNTQLQIYKVDIKGITNDPLLFPTPKTVTQVDGYPPALFVKSLSREFGLENTVDGKKNSIIAHCEIILKPHEQRQISLIIGYAYKSNFNSIDSICQQLIQGTEKTILNNDFKNSNNFQSIYSKDWLRVLPKISNETDIDLKREMIWHAYTLEAMAKYSDFYGETLLHQGTIYDYDWGIRASARDNFQHALPLIYTNPALARSILIYMSKRITSNGEIRLEECGYGYSSSRVYTTSDQQLWFLNLLSEYLRVTKDYNILLAKTKFFPVVNMPEVSFLDVVESSFKYLRDEVGLGPHGLVKLLNSDWSDAVYYIKKVQYNRVLMTGESHMNSTMTISILGNLIPILQSYQSKTEFSVVLDQIKILANSMSMFRTSVYNAFMKDLGDRNFSKRMYCDNQFYGEKNMFLEPQGFMLQMQELPLDRKKSLYQEIKNRVYTGEKLGAREQELPEFDDPVFDFGSRENGGIWYALNGPVICGVAQFDKPEALRLLKQLSFSNYSKQFPDYWTSYWSGTDVIESSLIPSEGLCDQTTFHWTFPVYCAHSHAWLLYCYFKIRN